MGILEKLKELGLSPDEIKKIEEEMREEMREEIEEEVKKEVMEEMREEMMEAAFEARIADDDYHRRYGDDYDDYNNYCSSKSRTLYTNESGEPLGWD
jgi:DNA-binding transcriptional MerR regulator